MFAVFHMKSCFNTFLITQSQVFVKIVVCQPVRFFRGTYDPFFVFLLVAMNIYKRFFQFINPPVFRQYAGLILSYYRFDPCDLGSFFKQYFSPADGFVRIEGY